jgi:transposase, IS5 family
LPARTAKGGPIEGLDLFGPRLQVAGAGTGTGTGTSPAGRRRLPIRLMVGLLYLKHAFGESDEIVIQRWSENPYWQFFAVASISKPGCPATRAA